MNLLSKHYNSDYGSTKAYVGLTLVWLVIEPFIGNIWLARFNLDSPMNNAIIVGICLMIYSFCVSFRCLAYMFVRRGYPCAGTSVCACESLVHWRLLVTTAISTQCRCGKIMTFGSVTIFHTDMQLSIRIYVNILLWTPYWFVREMGRTDRPDSSLIFKFNTILGYAS